MLPTDRNEFRRYYSCSLFVPLIESFRDYADITALQSAFNGMKVICEGDKAEDWKREISIGIVVERD